MATPLPPELDAGNPGAAGAALARRLLASIRNTIVRTNKSAGEFNAAQDAGGQKASAAMTDALLNVGGGGAIPLIRGMIVPALRNLEFSTYNKARRELANGADPRAVYHSVNAYNSPNDNVLRSVISDLGAKLKPAVEKTAHLGKFPEDSTLGDILDHPELFAKMPELAKIPVTTAWNQHNGASYYPTSSNDPLGKITLGTSSDTKTLLSTLLHETQHSVQDYGMMTPGGNPNQFLADPERLKVGVDAAAKTLNKTIADLGAKLPAGTSPGDYRKLRGTPEYETMKAARSDFLALSNLRGKAINSYMDIPGEQEARLVQEMLRRGIGTEVFPPDIVSSVKGLQPMSKPPLDPYTYHDTSVEIQKLLERFAPRVNNGVKP